LLVMIRQEKCGSLVFIVSEIGEFAHPRFSPKRARTARSGRSSERRRTDCCAMPWSLNRTFVRIISV